MTTTLAEAGRGGGGRWVWGRQGEREGEREGEKRENRYTPSKTLKMEFKKRK